MSPPPVLIDTGNVASGARAVIIPAPDVNHRVQLSVLYLLPVAQLSLSSITFDLEDTNQVGFGRYNLSVVGLPTNLYLPGFPEMHFDFAQFDYGVGIQMHNTSGSTLRLVGHASLSLII